MRFNGRIGERVYWLELKGADTGDGTTLPDPLIVGIYDRQGTYIPYSHVLGQSLTWNNDSGQGRNAITDFTEPCAGDYFVAVAGFEGSHRRLHAVGHRYHRHQHVDTRPVSYRG